MNYTEKELLLENIFFNVTGINFNKNNNLKKELFFSSSLHIQPRELLLVFCEVIENFNIKIPEEKLLNRQFTSFDNVLKIINMV